MYVGMINTDTTVTWEGGTAFMASGTLVLLAPGGALETAIGTGNITNVTARGPYQGGILGTSN